VRPCSPQCQLYPQQQLQQPFTQSQPFSSQLQLQQPPFISTQPQPSTSPPVANAGSNQVVSQGSLTTLSGAGSFATNSGAATVSYSWVPEQR
ncbi:MAG: hypothetical protein M3044_17435, partial [Thermoproteota archaeon]|nr:hypothetical protein [Thermoproteota archaeon]